MKEKEKPACRPRTGANTLRKIAAVSETLRFHLENVETATRAIERCEDEDYRREAVPVARNTVRRLRLARLEISRAIKHLDEYFGSRARNW